MYVFEIWDFEEPLHIIWAYKDRVLSNIFTKSIVTGVTYEVIDFLFLQNWIFFE